MPSNFGTDDPAVQIRSRVYSEPATARLLRAFAFSTGLMVFLEEARPPDDLHGPPCRGMARLGQARLDKCLLRRSELLDRVATDGTSASTRCPVGAFCLAAPVFARGAHVATLRAGGFTKKMGASKTRADAVRHLLLLIADELGNRAAALLTRAASECPAVSRAMNFIHSNSGEPLHLQEISRAAGVSRQHLCRIWKRHMGMPLHAYLTAIRIDRAKVLLEAGNRKIIDIAFECGFGSLSQFNRAFFHVTGVSPSHWQPERLAISKSEEGFAADK